MNSQLQMVARAVDALPGGVLVRALALVSPMLPAGAAATVSSAGLRVALPMRSSDVDAEVAQHSRVLDFMSGVITVPSAVGVEQHIVSPGDNEFMLLRPVAISDALAIAHLGAWVSLSDFVARAPLAQSQQEVSPGMLLSRYAHLAHLLAGALAVTGTLFSADELADRADRVPISGDWPLLTSACAEAALTFGFGAVFGEGEMIDVNALTHAMSAVSSVLATELGKCLGTSPEMVVAELACRGPLADILGVAERSS
jgi:hypothetical protein